VKIIQDISDLIDEEIVDAQKYARLYKQFLESDPELAKTYRTLSSEELGHVDRLHTQVVRLITEYRASHGEPPQTMMIIYEYLHKRNIQKVEDIKLMIA